MSQQRDIGTLVVVVLKAQHLHQPSFYKQDPYAQVSLSGLKKRTKVDQKGGQHPVWDDEFRFPVLAEAGRDRINRILEVSCYKDEQRGDDVFLGKGTVDIEETLKTGEFDDWVPLETSAGVRGEIYLELTFYANSLPPLTRRPSKLSPSDRIVRPAAYFTQGRQSNPASTPSSPQRGHSPVAGERTSSQVISARIPSSLMPAHDPQSQAPKQGSSHGVATSVVAAKHKDFPPLPANNDPSDTDPGMNMGVPTSLHPGGRSGPSPMPPQNQNQEPSIDRPFPETLPEQLHRTLNDAPIATLPSPFPPLQVPVRAYPTGMASISGERVGLIPSIVVAEHVEEHPPPAISTPFASSSMPTQENEPRDLYAARNDSLAYGPAGRVYMQPNSQAYITSPTQGCPPTSSLSQRPLPLQASHTPLSQPQQLHDTSPPTTTSPPLYQQYAQYSCRVPTPVHPASPQAYPQLRSTPQPQQQQAPYTLQSQQHSAFHQQPHFLPLQQQQYRPQYPSYNHTSHLPNVPQLLVQQHTVAPLQPYTQLPQQPQSYFTAPPPSSVQSSTPQPTPQPRPYFSAPPPPPPPPPPLYNQGGQRSVSVAQTPVPLSPLSQGPIPPAPSLQSVTPATPSLPPLITTPLPTQAVPDNGLASSTEAAVRQGQVEGEHSITAARMGAVLQEAKVTLRDAVRSADKERNVILNGQEGCDGSESRQRVGQDVREQGEDLRKQENLRRREDQRQEMGYRMREEERKQREEGSRKQEGNECRRIEEEERRRREEDQREEVERRMQEEKAREEEECKRQEQEELRREEERRKKEEEYWRQEEEHKRMEEEMRRNEELERQEEERRKQERVQRERDETERLRKAAEDVRRRRAEEAEAERRWQGELARIRARAKQEAADAAFARAQMEADEAERRKQDEADFVLIAQAQEEAEREEKLAQERRRQEEVDMEVARREQAHEEELEKRRQDERRRRMEDTDRELARRLDMELNLSG